MYWVTGLNLMVQKIQRTFHTVSSMEGALPYWIQVLVGIAITGNVGMHSLLSLPLHEYGRPPLLGYAYQMSF